MATSLTLENDSSLAQGYIKVNGSTAATLTTSGITGNLTGNVTGNLTGSLTAGGSLTLATAQTASGTAVDFTGIPSWVKRITVMFNGVSTSGVSEKRIQIGSGSFTTSGYIGSCLNSTSSGNGVTSATNGFGIRSNLAADSINGIMVIANVSSNTWIANGTFSNSAVETSISGGQISLSGTLDRLRITTVNGTDTFDAGTINISYEG